MQFKNGKTNKQINKPAKCIEFRKEIEGEKEKERKKTTRKKIIEKYRAARICAPDKYSNYNMCAAQLNCVIAYKWNHSSTLFCERSQHVHNARNLWVSVRFFLFCTAQRQKQSQTQFAKLARTNSEWKKQKKWQTHLPLFLLSGYLLHIYFSHCSNHEKCISTANIR